MQDCKLHYKWRVQYGNRSGASLVAEKQRGENWNMNFIYQDTVAMAEILQAHADEIRELKLNTFKRNRIMKGYAEKLRKAKQYKELYQWMKAKISQ